jgi:hypothetical protein
MSAIIIAASSITFAVAFVLYYLADNARRQAARTRQKVVEDVRLVVGNEMYKSSRDSLQDRVDTRNDVKNAVRAVVREMDLQIGYEVDCIAIPHTLLIDASFESHDYGDERITIKFKGTGAQWEELKQKLEKVNGRTSSEEKVQPKARDGKGA